MVAEGLTKEGKPYGDYHPDNIEYLELSWWIVRDEDSFYGYNNPSFGGTGYKLKKDRKEENGDVMWKKGSRINWGVSFSSADDLINIPLKLNTDFTVTNEDSKQGKFMEEIITFKNATFTLANIIHGVIWELSWYGGPEDREEKAQHLKEVVEEIKKDESCLNPINLKE
jgi:hypothetical protein